MKKAMFGVLIASCVCAISLPLAFAHQGHHHPEAVQSGNPHGSHDEHPNAGLTDNNRKQAAYQIIDRLYATKVLPIFQKKCVDCHGGEPKYPWYHRIPGIKQAIDSDIRESKEHIDLSGGFPFKSHATPEEDLDAFGDIAKEGSMPPFGYRLMHWDSKLTDGDKKAILEWVNQAQAELKK
jgi:hypothetical protein